MSLKLKLGDVSHDVTLKSLRPGLVVNLNGVDHRLEEQTPTGSDRAIAVDGRDVAYVQARDGNVVHMHLHGRIWRVEFVDPRDAARAEAAGSDEIRAPMPGAVISVEKNPGDSVIRGETVLTIESMKLQTNLGAPRDGVLASVNKSVGDTFEKDEVVAVMEPEDA